MNMKRPLQNERKRAREVLRAAGLLTEPTPTMYAIAAQSTATRAAVQACFAHSDGQPLSKIVIEQREPRRVARPAVSARSHRIRDGKEEGDG
jgi:tRNA A37 threonylcarbamoyladenosine synthetase subunit TsaC/SUA5/YrdC